MVAKQSIHDEQLRSPAPAPSSFEPLALDSLPEWSAWARALLDPTVDPPTDPASYTDEAAYDDRYDFLHERWTEIDANCDAFATWVKSLGREEPDVCSIDSSLYLASTDALLERERSTVRRALEPVVKADDTVIDAGCGWGETLGVLADSFPSVRVVGGDRSATGVAFARDLYAEIDRITVDRFDFENDLSLLDRDGAVLFTRGSLSTLGSLASVVDRIAERASSGSIRCGVHLEQTGPHPDTVLGTLREQYARRRGYDTGLYGALENHTAIEIETVSYDVIGANPLHPSVLIRWRVS